MAARAAAAIREHLCADLIRPASAARVGETDPPFHTRAFDSPRLPDGYSCNTPAVLSLSLSLFLSSVPVSRSIVRNSCRHSGLRAILCPFGRPFAPPALASPSPFNP